MNLPPGADQPTRPLGAWKGTKHMSRLLTKKRAGFTLLELMIVVAILGILAAVAIPAFMTYIRRSKTAEAATNVEKMFVAAATYYSKQHVIGQTITASVLSQCTVAAIVRNPATPTANKQTLDQALWPVGSPADVIGFTIADPVYYGYSALSSAAACALTSGSYTFIAEGDLDGDGSFSFFSQTAGPLPSGGAFELAKAGAIYVNNELE